MPTSLTRRPFRAPATLLLAFILTSCDALPGATGGAAPTRAAGTSRVATAPVGGPAVPSGGPTGTRPARATIAATFTPSTTRPAGAMTNPAATAASTLTVTPPAGPGGILFAIAGAGFAPNATLHAVGRNPEQEFVLNDPITAADDGTLRLSFNSLGRAPGVYTVTIGADMRGAMGMPGGVIARGAFTITEWGPIPTLTLEPERGPCAEREPAVIARGQNFPPNRSIFLYVRGTPVGRPLVGDDGAFAFPVRLIGCGPATPDGDRIRVIVPWIQHNVQPERELASATFTVATSAPPLPYVPTPPPDRR